MLSAMRKNAGSWMIKILLGIIVVAFIFMGAGSFNARRAYRVATVNGETISINDYQTAYDNILQNLRRQFGSQLNDEMIKMLNIKKQALDQVIDTAILHQVAEKNDIRVSKKELVASITRIKAFHDSRGMFDQRRYKMVLQQNRLNPEVFEAMQRESLLLAKLRSLVTGSVKVSNEEAREWYRWENTSVKIDYAVFSPDDFKDIKVSAPALQEYFKAHKDAYKTEPKIKARYVRFDPAHYLAKVTVSDDEIKQYYSDHEDEFQTGETITARQILLKLPAGAKADSVEKRRKEADKIVKKAKSGEDFEALVKKYSEGPAKEKGGLMGPFTREEMLKPLADKAFSMKINAISDPVRTEHGWHILKITDHAEPSAIPLADVSDKIAKKLSGQKAKSLAYDEAVALYDTSYSGDDLVKNIAGRDLKLVTTDFFTKKTGPAGVPDGPAFAKIAFDLPQMDISEVSEIGDAYYLIQVIDNQPSHVPPLDQVKEKVLVDAKQEKQQEAARSAAKQFLEKAKASGDMAAMGKQAGVKIRSITLDNRNKKAPALGSDGAVVAASFNLSMGKKFPDDVIKGEGGYYVIALKDRKAPLPQGYNVARSNIVLRLAGRKKLKLYDAWLANLRTNSDISISKKFADEGA